MVFLIHSVQTEWALEEFGKFSDCIGEDVYNCITVDMCVERRNSLGGTSSASTDEQILTVIEQKMVRYENVRQENQLLETCWNELLE